MAQKIRSNPVSYDVMEYLGEGLTGTVYKAIRSDPFRHLEQTVALKILKSKNSVRAWKQEFDSLARVQSQHCVRVFGFEWVNDRPALVLEFVSGISLRQLCLARSVPFLLAREILAQVQVGLNSLRDHGLWHGDLSPNNVMIDCDGCVKLLDFGLANHRHATPLFTAPELLAGQAPTFASDLYSFGALEKFLLKTESMRLRMNPSQRPPFEIPSHARQKELLAAAVRDLCEQQAQVRNMATRSIYFEKPKPRTQHWLWLMGLVLFVLAPRAQARMAFSRSALLKFRSAEWMQVTLDGEDLGFAPMDVLVSANRNHRLILKTANKAAEIISFAAQPNEIRRIHGTNQ